VFLESAGVLIATILSAQCTDKRVNMVTPVLFQRCRTATDYAAIEPEELEPIIQSTGFFRAKTKSIRACCAELVSKHGGEVPRTMEELHALPGSAAKPRTWCSGTPTGSMKAWLSIPMCTGSRSG
jgi:endonuclease-3